MMFSLLACVCFGSIFSGYVSGYPLTDYVLYFRNKGVSDYSNIWGMPSLTQFTVCFWMKSSDQMGTPFSYSVAAHANELLFFINKKFYFWIGDKVRSVPVSANDGKWHHICASWKNTGAWQFYKDGLLHMHSVGFQSGYIILGGGSLMLGQEQDNLGGGLSSGQSLKGMLANVNVWSSVLTANEINVLSKSCKAKKAGNMYKWGDFLYGVKGKTAIVIPSPCVP